jgi:hypothetical protein
VICSDETSVRVKGKNWWEWVFIGKRCADPTPLVMATRS